jgi:hypothetical protein
MDLLVRRISKEAFQRETGIMKALICFSSHSMVWKNKAVELQARTKKIATTTLSRFRMVRSLAKSHPQHIKKTMIATSKTSFSPYSSESIP